MSLTAESQAGRTIERNYYPRYSLVVLNNQFIRDEHYIDAFVSVLALSTEICKRRLIHLRLNGNVIIASGLVLEVAEYYASILRENFQIETKIVKE